MLADVPTCSCCDELEDWMNVFLTNAMKHHQDTSCDDERNRRQGEADVLRKLLLIKHDHAGFASIKRSAVFA